MEELQSNTPIPSPCVRLCTLDQHDVCVGCRRHLDEITGWHTATNVEKIAILARCEQRARQP